MKKYGYLVFLGIILLAAILRLFLLDQVPPGFTPDEAAQGYTAYSILKTGRDEWGIRLPLTPRSFGDFKPPLYTYLLIPFVGVLGLGETAVRLPAALAGVLSVVVMFFLARELLGSQKIALASAFLLAISPWHIQLSRGGFEAGLLVLLIPLGIYLFLIGIKKPVWLIWAAVPLVLSLFTYHSAKLTPLLIGLLVVFFFDRIKQYQKHLLAFLAIFSAGLILLLAASFQGGATRAGDITILNPTDGWQGVFEKRVEAVWANLPDPIARAFNNKLTYVVETFSKNYLQYFSFTFLFSDGPAEGFYGMNPGIGVLYLFELPLLLYAIYKIVRIKDKSGLFLVISLLIAPLPAALAKGPGYAANRAVIVLPFLVILSAYGLMALKKTKIRWLLIAVLIAVFFLFFAEDYFLHSRYVIAGPMQWGWREAVEYIEDVEGQYDQVIISRRFSEPQAYVMFYKAYDPKLVQEAAPDWLSYQKQGLKFLDQLGQYALGKYIFRNLHHPVDRLLKNTLLLGKPEDFFPTVSPIKVINYPNGKPAFWLVESDR